MLAPLKHGVNLYTGVHVRDHTGLYSKIEKEKETKETNKGASVTQLLY